MRQTSLYSQLFYGMIRLYFFARFFRKVWIQGFEKGLVMIREYCYLYLYLSRGQLLCFSIKSTLGLPAKNNPRYYRLTMVELLGLNKVEF